jgi:hypothetical protein
MAMNSKIESATRETIKQTGTYVQFHIYRVPKKIVRYGVTEILETGK